jgi:sugar phosphate isomerase/epimerase
VEELSAANTSAVPIRLGFDSYSIRDFRWKDIQLLDYAANLKLDTVQLSGLGDYESLEPEHLAKVKDHAARVGVAIDAGVGCICTLSSGWYPKDGTPEELLRKGMRVAKAVGANSVRCYMGGRGDRPQLERCMEATIAALRSVRTEALDLSVRIAVENHSGDMQAREVKTIIEEAGKDYVASCLDTGNPIWCVENPFVTLEILAPYVVTTHVRDSAVFETPRGAAGQWVALGDGCVDFVQFVAEFRRLCPKSSMQLEIITGRPPTDLPYLEPEFWKAFSKPPASEFARFVALAKSGHPFMGAMVIEDVPGKRAPVMTEALKEQQRIDLERSFEYARKKLNVGINWRG